MGSLGHHLLTAWSACSLSSSRVIPDNDHDLPCEEAVHLHSTFRSLVDEVINLCCHLSGLQPHDCLDSSLFSIHCDERHIWNILKSVRLPPTVPNYSSIIHKVIFGSELVYDKQNLRDGVFFLHCGVRAQPQSGAYHTTRAPTPVSRQLNSRPY